MKLGIIGKGFVGSAVFNGFDRDVETFVVDPKINNNTIQGLVDFDPPLLFVCVPTPEGSTGEVDTRIADSVLQNLHEIQYKGVVVIKSTITPDNLIRFKNTYDLRMVYNPEFLTEANAKEDFLNPSIQVLGGEWEDCEVVEKAYVRHSSVKIVPTFKVDLVSASLIKYTINSWLATKVMFFNELHNLHRASGATSSWQQFTEMVSQDPRIGKSHMKVPGADGEFGFGGHCFPKDTKALAHYAKSLNAELTVLEETIISNENIRKKESKTD